MNLASSIDLNNVHGHGDVMYVAEMDTQWALADAMNRPIFLNEVTFVFFHEAGVFMQYRHDRWFTNSFNRAKVYAASYTVDDPQNPRPVNLPKATSYEMSDMTRQLDIRRMFLRRSEFAERWRIHFFDRPVELDKEVNFFNRIFLSLLPRCELTSDLQPLTETEQAQNVFYAKQHCVPSIVSGYDRT